jgi:hypothetical protein
MHLQFEGTITESGVRWYIAPDTQGTLSLAIRLSAP